MVLVRTTHICTFSTVCIKLLKRFCVFMGQRKTSINCCGLLLLGWHREKLTWLHCCCFFCCIFFILNLVSMHWPLPLSMVQHMVVLLIFQSYICHYICLPAVYGFWKKEQLSHFFCPFL